MIGIMQDPTVANTIARQMIDDRVRAADRHRAQRNAQPERTAPKRVRTRRRSPWAVVFVRRSFS